MRRRAVIALMGGVGATWPFVARSQQTTATRIGVVLQGGLYYAGVEGLREGLKAAGLEDGKQIMLSFATPRAMRLRLRLRRGNSKATVWN